MNRVLILTNNVSVESHLQSQLQKLNLEVLVSVSMWDLWRNSGQFDPFMETFQWIFLSETLSDEEAKNFSEQFDRDCLIRIVGEEPTKEAVDDWRTWQIFDWILSTTTLERLREKLNHKTLLFQIQCHKEPATQSQINQKKNTYPIYFSDIHFTKLEKKIIYQLIASGNASSTREELCHYWNSKNENSKLSQLSSSITKIKRKVSNVYGIEDSVVTIWGEGYQLSQFFYHCLLKGEYRNYSKIPSTQKRNH